MSYLKTKHKTKLTLTKEQIAFFKRLDNNKLNNFEHLFKTYYHQLFLYANSVLKNENDSQDIAQEVFIKFWITESYKRIFSETHLKKYLIRSVKNACIDKLKSTNNFFDLDVTLFNNYENEVKKVNENLILKVRKEIAELSPQTKEILNCVFFNKMKYQEAADELEISINTVKTLLRKGLAKLREKFKEDMDILLFIIFSDKFKKD